MILLSNMLAKDPQGLLKRHLIVYLLRCFASKRKVKNKIIHQGHYRNVAYVWRVSWRETSSYVFPAGIDTIFAAWIRGYGLAETAHTAVGTSMYNYKGRKKDALMLSPYFCVSFFFFLT